MSGDYRISAQDGFAAYCRGYDENHRRLSMTSPPKLPQDLVEVPNGPGILMPREKAERDGLAFVDASETKLEPLKACPCCGNPTSWNGERAEMIDDHPHLKIADPDDDATFIAAARNDAPDIAKAFLEACEVIRDAEKRLRGAGMIGSADNDPVCAFLQKHGEANPAPHET